MKYMYNVYYGMYMYMPHIILFDNTRNVSIINIL
jgi:hypothetical protein